MGYEVTGIDVSPDLIAIAEAKARKALVRAEFSVADIRALASDQHYDGILCRGVLNDLISDRARLAACEGLGRALRRRGLLVLDVREWHTTALRKREQPVFERTVETEKGRLTFRSQTTLDAPNRRLIVSEQHILIDGELETTRHHSFVMRCWTGEELRGQMTTAGFSSISLYGDYDANAPPGLTERLVAVASLGV
jgi:SAM-dependent methyltransferase